MVPLIPQAEIAALMKPWQEKNAPIEAAKNVDQPIAALLDDLKATGLLDTTLVVWATEFGRMPFNNIAEAKGREHHAQAFTSWLAGAGVKGGIVHGATDEIGLRASVDPVHIRDFHATILHLIGFDPRSARAAIPGWISPLPGFKVQTT